VYSLFNIARLIVWSRFILILLPTFLAIINKTIYLIEWTILPINSAPLTLMLIADSINLRFSCVVLFISANVLWFSTIYIAEEKFKTRFTVLVLLFVLSINMLLFIPHLIVLLLGWDGLGLVSFILVIYYQNPSSMAAAILTALTNRIGDVAILLAIALTLNQGHWYIINITSTVWLMPQVIIITLAAITKRAQMPFSRWLPAAIAAPTPVSALVHSSTLVTAGVFLLIRFYPMLHKWIYFNIAIIIVATTTTFIAGLRANTECDFKKIVALSTLRQLGVIMFSLGLNMPILAYFHILTHALFKALLFICVGSFINYHIHRQDLRWIGNLTTQMPTIISCIIVANIALSGFPFLAGFYSKDIVIETIISNNFNILIISITIIRLGLTRFYSTRASVVAIIRHKLHSPFSALKEPINVVKAVILLSTTAIIIGSIIIWLNSDLLSTINILPIYIKLMPLILILLGIILAWLQTCTNSRSLSILLSFPQINFASCTIWFIVPLSTQFTIKFPTFITHSLIKSFDQGWIEQMSGQGINKIIIYNTSIIIQKTPTYVNSYMLFTVIIMIIIIIWINNINKFTFPSHSTR